jgi:hypothetical protein
MQQPDRLQTFIDEVDLVVRGTDDEHEITARVAERMSARWPAVTGFRRRSRDPRPCAT